MVSHARKEITHIVSPPVATPSAPSTIETTDVPAVAPSLSAEQIAEEESLKHEILVQVAELQERTKWEALRLHQLLQQVENETSAEYIGAMEQQQEAAEQALAQEVSARADESIRTRDVLLREKSKQAQKNLENAIEAQEAEMRSRLEDEFDADCSRYEQELKQAVAAEVEEFNKEPLEAARQRQQLVDRLESDVDLVQAHINAQLSAESTRDQVYRVSAAGMAFVSQIETADELSAEIVAMEKACGSDAVIAVAITMIKKIQDQRASMQIASGDPAGVPSILQLEKRFQIVRKASWCEICVPDGLRTLEGRLLGIIVSAIRFPSSTGTSGNISEDLLVRASHLLRGGELAQAVATLEKLKGPGAEPIRDWLVDARHRLVADQAGSLVRARVSLLNRSVL